MFAHTRDVVRAVALRQHHVNRPVDRGGRLRESQPVAQQHRGRSDRAERVRDALPRDPRRRAVDRLEQPGPRTQRCRRQQPERPHQHGRFVAQDIAEHVLGEDHVERRRLGDQLHRRKVDVQVLQAHVGVVATHPRDHVAPQLRHLEHVSLVDRRHEAAPSARRLEGDPCDPLDLRRGIGERVDGTRLVAPPRLPVVQSPRQLAHDQQVDTVEALGFQGRAVGEYGVHGDGTQIRVYPEQRPQREETRFRSQVAGRLIERGVAHRAQQHGIGTLHGGARLGRQRIAGGSHSRGADGKTREGDLHLEALAHRLEHPLRLGDHLGADAVARQDGNRERRHARLRSKSAIRDSWRRVRPISSRPRSSISRRYGSIRKAALKPASSATRCASRSIVSR